MFLEHGYRVLAVDLRGHGDSDGQLVTFGALEADDVRRWIDRVKGPAGSCVYSFGGSLGGFYALQASDAPGLCGVISTSGEASRREIAFDRIGQRLHTGPWIGRTLLRPGVELGFLYARVRYGVDLGGASAFRSVAGPGAPIFVIQGSDDDVVPQRHAQLIQAANPSRVSVWIVPGGSHAPAAIGREEYTRRVLEFVDRSRRPWP
jgi:pimeloyl-ACP methyl ester carboxylesterase